MSGNKGGAFGSRKGIPTPALFVQGNTMSMSKDPAPWFADLDRLATECTALTTSPGMVLQYFDDPELMAKMDRPALNESMQTLLNHVAEQKARLRKLVEETNRLREATPKMSPEGSLPILQHSEDFTTFMNDWTRIVFFAIDKVLDHFRAAGEEIPFICPDSPGFQKVSAHQMTRAELDDATTTKLADLEEPAAEPLMANITISDLSEVLIHPKIDEKPGRGETPGSVTLDDSPFTKAD